MATNYTGNPSAVQAPSPAPGPGVAPIISLPADTDGWTVANFYQALKTLADFSAYVLVGGAFLFDKTLTLTTSTPDVANNAGTVIDSSIDWRHRMLWIDMVYLGSASQLPLHGIVNPITGQPDSTPPLAIRAGYFTSGGGLIGSIPQLPYIASGGAILQVDTSGSLRLCRNTGHAAPIDATNGDIIQVRIAASTQF